jgi:L-ascorbate metabolism protein UlaG (beta-lactamase superfamily)
MKLVVKLMLIQSSLFLLVHCSSLPPEFSETEWYERVISADRNLLYAPHETPEGTYFNPWQERLSHPSGRSWLFNKKEKFEKFPEKKYAAVPNNYSYLSDNKFDSISFAGHASFIIKMDEKTIFTDPFLSRAALIKPKEVYIKFDYSKVPKTPVVLISHNHYDHLDRTTVRQLIKKKALFIVPLGVKELIADYGAKEVYELDWWQSITLDSIKYTLLPAQHWSRRLGKTQESGKTLWGGYLIQGSKTIYFSGDTGYFIGFKEYGNLFDIDYAILGAGAYEPRWFMHYSHMSVQEFFLAAEDLKAKNSIPMHFGTISLSDEPLLFPLYEIENILINNPDKKEKIRPLRVGEYLKIQ